MVVRVLVFGILRERWPERELTLTMNEGATAGDVLARFAADAPELAGLWERVAVAVNREYAAASTLLRDGDEVALLPPVSGG